MRNNSNANNYANDIKKDHEDIDDYDNEKDQTNIDENRNDKDDNDNNGI